MCRDESFFNELTKVEDILVSSGDDPKMVIKGHGTIQHMKRMDGFEKSEMSTMFLS